MGLFAHRIGINFAKITCCARSRVRKRKLWKVAQVAIIKQARSMRSQGERKADTKQTQGQMHKVQKVFTVSGAVLSIHTKI